MSDSRLLRQLNEVARRYRRLRMWQLLALVWLVAAALGGLLWAFKPPHANPLPLLAAATATWAAAACFVALRSARDPAWLARRVEDTYPELRTCLLAAIEQDPALPDGRYGYLQGRVIRQALDHARAHRWDEIVSKRQVALAGTANVIGLVLFAVAAAALAVGVRVPQAEGSAQPDGVAGADWTMTIEPGNTEVERGTGLLVLARVTGPMPPEAALVFRADAGDESRLPMAANLDDPVFGGRIPVVEQPLEYRVEAAGRSSPSYRITVFEYPRLERADARLVFPAYTRMEERLVQDVRTVSVVEGTRLTLQCFLNKPVASATLNDARNAAAPPVTLAPAADDPLRYEATWTCEQSRRLTLALVDDSGRANPKSVQFTINVLPNQPPSLKPLFPAKDLEVSPLEELDVQATVWDDFGVAKLGLTYALAGGEPVDVVIAEDAAGREKHEVAHVVRLEELRAEPDQLLTYHWWAEDTGSDGQPRRVMGDMYFAEVRPFEEIFRQGEPPPGGQQGQQQSQQGQGQNAQQAQELARLQKDIINAIWKLVRRETGAALTDAFPEDAEQVRLSQEQALEQATALAERIEDEQSQGHAEAVLEHMRAAAEQLTAAAETPAREPLRPALASAQAAYQSLLKLRAREHEVVRQQQQQQGQQSSQQQSSARSEQQRQQLQQLDLKDEENRYETERAAQERREESAEDRENRQVQNRLRELARRQGDMNERMKELHAALEEARTEERKEELRRQLQRLQEEQRQILQDTDELQSRMEQPENAERMSEERQQLEETRDQVRRASEALDEQRVSQAAAAGTRAERQFEDLREELRRRAADRFNEEMREMRRAARELEQSEQRIAEQLQGPEQPQDGPLSLRENETPREEIAGEIGRQRQRLDELQERMKSTVGEAEETEPLLSQRLYDAVRDVQDRKVEQSLQQAERAVRLGVTEEARRQEAAAGEGVRELREAVERAAEGVLGDEAEALRRARDELRDLSRELNQEIHRNTGELPPDESNDEPGERSPVPRAEGRPGEQSDEERQPDDAARRGQGGRPPSDRPGEERNPDDPGQREAGRSGEPADEQRQNETGNREPGQPQQGQGDGQPMGEQRPGENEQQAERGRQGEGGRPNSPASPGEPQEGEERSPGRPQPGQDRRGQRGRPRLGDPDGGVSEGGAEFRERAPLTGEGFREWSDRLRDVEEMVDDPDLRAEAARIRERARSIRAEHKRHSAEPNWELVQRQVAGPLFELQQRVSEELLRRTTKKALVPLDRDPVPPRYAEETRRYYERLGSGK